MAGRTNRFALNKFGAGTPGTLTDDGGKYTALDRDVIDKILAAYETHDHKGGSRLADPTDRPTLSLDTTTGSLPAARTYFYRVGFVDKYNLETKASPEFSVTTPTPLQAPGQPSITMGDGGAVITGITYYALSYKQGTSETDLGAAGLITVTSDRRTATVLFPTVPSTVTEISVWRQGGTESAFTRIGTVAYGALSFIDTGAVPPNPLANDPTNRPSGANLTSSTNTVTVTTPHPSLVAADPSDIKRWRLYRSTQSGVYSSRSLLAEVIATVNLDGTGGLVTTFVDDGNGTLGQGAPLDVSQTLTPSTAILVAAQGATTVTASLGGFWRLVADLDGGIVTTESEVNNSVGRLLLEDTAGVTWRVAVDDLGGLSTGVAAAGANETVFPATNGPILPTPDATLTYMLTVATDGALVTMALGTGLGGVVGGGGGGGVGPRGPAGATGPRGADGADGAAGATGATGPTGSTGAPGPGVPAGGTTGQVLAKVSGTSYDTTWVDASTGGAGSTSVEVIAASSSYVLTADDGGKVIEMDSALGITVFIPDDVDVALPVGTVIEVDQVGTGGVNFAASNAAVIQSAGGRVSLSGQYAGATLRKRATDTWILVGSLA